MSTTKNINLQKQFRIKTCYVVVMPIIKMQKALDFGNEKKN